MPGRRDGCSFLIEDESQVINTMETALFDKASVDQVLANFRLRFPSGAGVAKEISRRILEAVGQSGNGTLTSVGTPVASAWTHRGTDLRDNYL